MYPISEGPFKSSGLTDHRWIDLLLDISIISYHGTLKPRAFQKKRSRRKNLTPCLHARLGLIYVFDFPFPHVHTAAQRIRVSASISHIRRWTELLYLFCAPEQLSLVVEPNFLLLFLPLLFHSDISITPARRIEHESKCEHLPSEKDGKHASLSFCFLFCYWSLMIAEFPVGSLSLSWLFTKLIPEAMVLRLKSLDLR